MSGIVSPGPGRSAPRLEIDLEGAPHTAAMLEDAAARGFDMRPAMRRIKDVLTAGNVKQFKTKGAYLGTPWPANTPGTLAKKAARGVSSLMSVMVESGDTEHSLSGGKGKYTRISKGSVKVGTTVWWSVFAQGGAKGNRKGVEPPRPLVGIGDVEARISIGLLEDHLLGRLA